MKKNKLNQMVGIALLIAMIVVLQFVGTMIPSISGVSISLVLIPVVLGSAVYGIHAGALLGGVFSCIVIINCITGTDAGGAMVFQANPTLCILVVLAKGILAGTASGLVYGILAKKNGYLAMLAAAIVCPVVNTGVFLTCMALFFKNVLAVWANGSDILTYVLASLVLCNFVPELLINMVFSPAGQRIHNLVKKI